MSKRGEARIEKMKKRIDKNSKNQEEIKRMEDSYKNFFGIKKNKRRRG